MVHENEIVMLLIGLGSLLFLITNHAKLTRLPNWKLLVAGFTVLLISWLATVVEGFFWEKFFNYVEHIGYGVSSILVALWFWKVMGAGSEPHV